ncbi:GNAT family N-acetyltransferase [Emticicia agri]|uniref:GNAT family N-acetyltransferase n=1 Tax=Emticicia agri TaxID=2492393 RepID=A0A4Q5LTG1_9BACT|nr:GNAT family N-acetyltransferase [Emticicia agri]RYU92901.1 GNAT family N-acetyltransferase [Emticicia agri]
MREYSCLIKQQFSSDKYAIVPIREEDKYAIMEWRNEQIYHLRQAELLTTEKQDWYFTNIVAKLFTEENPKQLLFSYLENGICIGYGGLVHINWIDKNAEISFIIKTELEKEYFEFHWTTYLSLIEQVAFIELNFHKIFTYAFDIRPHLYQAIEKSNYLLEARLKDHCLFQNRFIDVLIHSKINAITLRKADENDLMQYFEWTNDEEVRKQSFNSNPISLENHSNWFHKKLADKNCLMLIAENAQKEPIGQVRFEKDTAQKISVIGVSLDKSCRGKGLAGKILEQASVYFLKENPDYIVEAYIKAENKGSLGAFSKAGFSLSKHLDYQGIESVLYTKSNS